VSTQELQTVEEAKLEKVKEQGKVVLRVEGLYKKFCRNLKRSMIYGMTDLAKGFVGIPPKSDELRKDEFWALKGIDFELRENEILGIIGANGSGKSTLLRVLTGIFPPDKGSVWIDGKVGGIIALGAGMHPHMTGRENIYLNGTILGMTKEELDAKFDEIVDFAELGDFLEAPLSTYSSGMKVRLGFAVAVHCQPEILLIDEVLAVGDLSFRNKSMDKMAQYASQSKAIIYISHNIEQIRTLCKKVMVLHNSEIQYIGNTFDAIQHYTNLINRQNYIKKTVKQINQDTEYLELKSIKLYQNKIEVQEVENNNPLEIQVTVLIKKQNIKPIISLMFTRQGNMDAILSDISNEGIDSIDFDVNIGINTFVLKYKNFNLKPGLFELALVIKEKESGKLFLKDTALKQVMVISESSLSRSLLDLEKEWQLIN